MDRTDQTTPEDFASPGDFGDQIEENYTLLLESASPDEFTFVYLTYNLELLLKVRDLYFSKRIADFISERYFLKTADNIEDVRQFEKILLENEIGLMDNFLERMKINELVSPEYGSEFIEVDKYKSYLKGRLANYNKVEPENSLLNIFKLSGKKGTKINAIKIFNAFYGLQIIELANGQLPDKGLMMKVLGSVLGADLSNYHSDLSQSKKEVKLETYLKVFKDLEAQALKYYESKD